MKNGLKNATRMPANANSGWACRLGGVWVIMPLKYLIFLAGQLVSYSYLQWRQSVRFNMAASLMGVKIYDYARTNADFK
ncbi:MAG: hypothetical protein IJU89_00300 [Alphaproteobacteria bacterium]|nr:hypothetical protein [Alphaproteobacteria bacterium]